jgi:ribonucleoside-diphosphate reductase beta chain
MLNGVEHANFFETRATEYSKAATRGDWNSVWDNFDRRQKAKAEAANDAPVAGDGPDMFEASGVAAEKFDGPTTGIALETAEVYPARV